MRKKGVRTQARRPVGPTARRTGKAMSSPSRARSSSRESRSTRGAPGSRAPVPCAKEAGRYVDAVVGGDGVSFLRVGLLAAYSGRALGPSKHTVEKPDTVFYVLSSVGILSAVYALLLILLRS